MVSALAVGVTASDFECRICKSILQDPFATSCGHTFCHACIHRHLEHNSSCPDCSAYLSTDHVYPNFLLSKVCRRLQEAEKRQALSEVEQLRELLQGASAPVKLQDVSAMLQLLQDRKTLIEQQQADSNMDLLLHFLQHSRSHKTRKMQDLQDELQMLESDILQVESRHSLGNGLSPNLPAASRPVRNLRDALLQSGDAASEATMPRPSSAPSGAAPRRYSGSGRPHMGPGIPGVPAHAQAVLNGPAHQMLLAASAHQRQARLAARMGASAGTASSAMQHAAAPTLQPDMQRAPQHAVREPTPPAEPRQAQYEPGMPAMLPHHATGAMLRPALAISEQPDMAEDSHAERDDPTGSQTGSMQDASALAGSHTGSLETQSRTVTSSGDLDAAGDGANSSNWLITQHSSRAGKRRLVSQFNDLQRCYLRLRNEQPGSAHAHSQRQPNSHLDPPGPDLLPNAKRKRGYEESSGPALDAEGVNAQPLEDIGRVGAIASLGGLQEFARMLSTFTQCSKLKVVAHIPHPCARQTTSILSSIDFDRDAHLFATAGVSKRISLYNYDAIVADAANTAHKPCSELVTRSKLSCLAWNAGEAAHLISSDYEGVVTLWDVAAGNPLSEYEAHERRIWSIDFCKTEPALFASGSDDGCVKIWNTNMANHVGHLPMRANVCCVNFSPTSGHDVAIGSADHHVHLYDLRNSSQAMHIFKGHRKAVSYVRFMSGGRVVSASTDSTLRLWDASGVSPQRTYDGHMNEKNFVGLSAEGEFIACGSETNEVHVYHQAMSKPLTQRLFAPPAADASPPHDSSQFISAVCWKPRSQLLLAASSTGAVRLMQLTS